MIKTSSIFKKLFKWNPSNIGVTIIFIGIGIALIILFTGNYISYSGGSQLNPIMIGYYGSFFGGVVGSIFSLAGFFIIFSTFKSQQKQNVNYVYFELLNNLNNVRYNNTFYKKQCKSYCGLEAIKKISEEIPCNCIDIFNKDPQIIMNMIDSNLNMIYYYVNCINSVSAYLYSNRNLLGVEYDYYINQLFFNLIEEEKKLICAFFRAQSLEKTDLIHRILNEQN